MSVPIRYLDWCLNQNRRFASIVVRSFRLQEKDIDFVLIHVLHIALVIQRRKNESSVEHRELQNDI